MAGIANMAASVRAHRGARPSWWTRLGAALALFVSLLALSLPAFAWTPPPLDGHVVDTAGKLSADDIRDLDAKLDGYRRQTGFAIVALVVGSLDGETIDDVAYTAFSTWGVGDKGKDNGVLLVIAPNERKVRIETGKGVGGALTDLQSNDIIREVIAPLLRQDRFRDAVDQGTIAIARALSGTVPGQPRARPRARAAQETSPLRLGLMILGIVVVIFLAIVSPTFRSILFFFLLFGRRGGGGGGGGWGGGGGGSGYGGGGGESGGGGSSGDY